MDHWQLVEGPPAGGSLVVGDEDKDEDEDKDFLCAAFANHKT
jgi:hypothetical protein